MTTHEAFIFGMLLGTVKPLESLGYRAEATPEPPVLVLRHADAEVRVTVTETRRAPEP